MKYPSMKVDIEEIMDKCTENLEKVYSNGNLVHGVSNLLLIILTKLGLISCRAIKRKFRMSYIILAQLLQPDNVFHVFRFLFYYKMLGILS